MVFGLYLIKNEAGQRINVNGERYRTMITSFSLPEARDFGNVLFQQERAAVNTKKLNIPLYQPYL